MEQAFNNLGTGIAQPFKLSQGLPAVATNNVQNPQANIAQFGSAANPLTLTDYNGFTQASPLPYVEQWNFGMQREIAKGTIVEVNYVGTHGVHLPVELPTNTVPYDPAIDAAVALANTTLATQQARPYPGIGSFNSINMEGTSSYQALQASVRRQYGSNLTFVANYMRSKSIDDASGIYNFSQPSGLNLGQFPQQFLGLNKGLSEFDRPNDFTAAVLYRTRGNRWVRNFEIYPMLTAHSGLPLYIGQTNENAAQTRNQSAAPLRCRIPASVFTRRKFPTEPAFNICCRPAPPTSRWSPPDLCSSDRVRHEPRCYPSASAAWVETWFALRDNWISIFRSAGHSPCVNACSSAIRMEAYNALNHTNFQAPASSLTLTTNSAGQPIWNSPTYGVITAANQSRFLQLVGRFDF